VNRALGPYAWAYWMMFCNVVCRSCFWFKKPADEPDGVLMDHRMLVNVGMWFERFVIVV
jgi:hypothetical protein